MAFTIDRYHWTPEQEELALLQLMERLKPDVDVPVEFEIMSDHLEQVIDLVENGDRLTGPSSGLPSIDRMTMGFGAGDIIVIYGYTSMGKSQLAQNIALNYAHAGHPVLFIGLELTNKQNKARFFSMYGDNDRASSLPIIMPKKVGIGYKEIRNYVKGAVGHGTKLVVVDQLQDLVHSLENRASEIELVMRELKHAAIEFEVPIIVVSHVNRAGAGDKPPPLETLRGSAGIEQVADIALSVWQDHDATPGTQGYKKLAVLLAKNRQRGMKFRGGLLDIGDNMRLKEPLDDIFLGISNKLDLRG